MKNLNNYVIEELKCGAIVLQFNSSFDSVDDLNQILNAAFPKRRIEAKGVSTYYAAVQEGTDWTNIGTYYISKITLPIIPMRHFFEENVKVKQNTEAMKIAEKKICESTDMKYTTVSGQEVFLSLKDIETISQFHPKIKEVEMTEAEFEDFMEYKGWPEPTKHANRMMFAGILKSETVTQYSYPVKLSQ